MSVLEQMSLASSDATIEDHWREALAAMDLSSAELLQVSPLDVGRRVYRKGNSAYKIRIRHLDESASLRVNNYEKEYKILEVCREANLNFVPRAIKYLQTEHYELIEMAFFDGVTLSKQTSGCVPKTLWNVLVAITRLAYVGISHNDVRVDNILVDANLNVAVIDFDQATQGGFMSCLLAGLLGFELRKKGTKMHGSYLTVIKECVKKCLPTSLLVSIQRLRNSRKAADLPVLPENSTDKLRLLLEAWRLGQSSDANAPDAFAAYYSLEVDGHCFPGERPWLPRWTVLSSVTDFEGKNVLELGCNMGLLSTFLLKDKKAANSVATDVDSGILKAAKLVAKAYDVAPTFVRQDFDSPENWEEILDESKPDVVFALSVLNWVKDKERLLKFLGRYREVIFEGHDSVAVETDRFKQVGFKDIKLIAVSERNRPLLHCRK